MSEYHDSYRLLEVSADASPEEIRRAYLFLVNIWHPDRFVHEPVVQGRVEDKLKVINDAYKRIKEAPLLHPQERSSGAAAAATRIPGRVLTPAEWMDRARLLTAKPIRLKPGEAIDWSNVENLSEHIEGIRAYRQAVALDPSLDEGWYGLAKAHVLLGETAEAIKAFEAVVRLRPDHAAAWVGLGAGRAETGDFAAAAKAFAEAVRLQPDPSVFYSLGCAHAQLGEPHEAAAAFREAVRLNPDFAEAWCSLGVEYAFPGPQGQVQPEEAIVAFRAAIRLKPDLAEAWCGLGSTRLGLKLHEEAVDALREAVRIKPDYADAWYSLAVAARYSSRPEANAFMKEAYARLRLLNRDSASKFKELLPYRLRLSLMVAGRVAGLRG
jgi:tetratricopeptide (TPR) repeat protein